MDIELIADEDQHKYEGEIVAELLKAGWLPDVEYVARYEAFAASGSPMDEAIHHAKVGDVLGDTGGLSVRLEYGEDICSLYDRPQNVAAWVKGRVPSPVEARHILDQYGRRGTPNEITSADVLVNLKEEHVAYSSPLEKDAEQL